MVSLVRLIGTCVGCGVQRWCPSDRIVREFVGDRDGVLVIGLCVCGVGDRVGAVVIGCVGGHGVREMHLNPLHYLPYSSETRCATQSETYHLWARLTASKFQQSSCLYPQPQCWASRRIVCH